MLQVVQVAEAAHVLLVVSAKLATLSGLHLGPGLGSTAEFNSTQESGICDGFAQNPLL